MSTTGWTGADAARLAELEAAFEHAGGRGPGLADEIDFLRFKRDGLTGPVTLLVTVNREPGQEATEVRADVIDALTASGYEGVRAELPGD